MITITCRNDLRQFIHFLRKSRQHPAQGRRIGHADIPPHDGITGGDTGKITEPPGGVTKYLVILFHTRQCIHQAKGQHMRQMRSGSQHFVMVRDRHFADLGATGFPHAAHPGHRFRRIAGMRRQDHPAVFIEFCKRSFHTISFCARNGMAGHQVGRHLTKHFPGIRHHTAFATAAVSDQRRLLQMRFHGRKSRLHGAQRYGEKHHVGALNRFTNVMGIAVNDPQFHRFFQVFPATATADDFLNNPSLA